VGWGVGVVWVRRSGTYRRGSTARSEEGEHRSDGSGGSETQAQRGCTGEKTEHLLCVLAWPQKPEKTQTKN